MKNHCYMTLITKNKYIKGANLLNERLKIINSQYELIALITPNIDASQLDMNYKIIEDKLENDYLKKFYCLNYIEFDKIIFLDADLIILNNIDYIFNEFDNCSIGWTYRIEENLEHIQPNGGVIYFQPDSSLLQCFINDSKLYNFREDEDALFRYFYHGKSDKNIQNNNYLHLGGKLKYWESKYFKESYNRNSDILHDFIMFFNLKRE